jgi:hypothetical protein
MVINKRPLWADFTILLSPILLCTRYLAIVLDVTLCIHCQVARYYNIACPSGTTILVGALISLLLFLIPSAPYHSSFFHVSLFRWTSCWSRRDGLEDQSPF